MKKVKASLAERGASEDEIKEFETGAAGFAKKIVANFKDYEFLIGESMDPDAMYVQYAPGLSVFAFTNNRIGSFSSTTVRTVSPRTSLCGSTVSRRPRCKRFSQNMAERNGAEGSKDISYAAPEPSAASDIPRTSMSNTVDTNFGNNLEAQL